jgi:ribosomal protein S18 acetylase RimI-like enzyme
VAELRIRPPERGDAARLAHVQLESWTVLFRGLLPDGHLDRLEEGDRTVDWERLLGRLSETEGEVLVAERGDEVVGFAHLGPTDDEDLEARQVGELYALHVLPEDTGQGIGRALLEAAAERLGERFGLAVLWMLAGNQRARALYESTGWAEDGATRRFADATEIRFRRPLAR